eukprot:PITA_26161
MNQSAGTIPLPQPTLLAPYALQQNPQTNVRPQLPAQPNPNPNNRPVQSIQIIEALEPETELRECNDLQLRFGRIIEIEGDKNAQIPLLQAIQDIPIYAKTIKELCIKKEKSRITTNPTIQVVGTLSDLLSGREAPVKYEDPGNPIVIVQINGHTFPNALVDLGAAINILTTTMCQKFGVTSLDPTTTLLELVDRSVVRPKGTLHDVMASVDSWEYPVDFLIINPKNQLDGHPLILGRPWLATADAYIGCRQCSMTITRGSNVKNLALYPLAQPSLTIMKTNKQLVSYLTKNIRSPLTIEDALEFKDQTEDDIINNFINQSETKSHVQCHMIEAAFDNELEEYPLKDTHDQCIPTTSVYNSKTIEIEPGKTLNINKNMTAEQEEKLVQLLRKYKEAFAWDCPDMKGIDP